MTALLLICVVILGAVLRSVNLSPFKFYPDAYQSLVVAHNISAFHSVIGPLGSFGLIYPYFLMWTRPGYPLLINLFTLINHDLAGAAQTVSLVCGTLAISISFLFIRKLFNSNLAGLCAALLLAVSFDHTVWGGFIYTEAAGIFLLLLFLWRLVTNLELPSKWADTRDFLTGALFGLAVFTRYEYIVLIAPVSLLIFFKSPNPLIRLSNIFASLAFVSALILTFLFPLDILIAAIFPQLHRYIIFGAVLLLATLAFITLSRLLSAQQKRSILNFLSLILTAFFWLVPAWMIFKISGVREFFQNDFLLGITSLIGLTLLLRSPKRGYGLFAAFSIILLYPMYYSINPSMERYLTHLIPFLLVFSAYALLRASQLKITYARVAAVIFVALVSFQVLLTFRGVKDWDGGTWWQVSYEERSAKLLPQKISVADPLLIASMPEAYYYFTGFSTQSVLENDRLPFLDIDDSLNSRRVVIIEDMGMRDLFPNFARFLDQNMGQYRTSDYWVGETYHFSIRSKKEDQPVILYQTTLGNLKQKISSLPRNRLK